MQIEQGFFENTELIPLERYKYVLKALCHAWWHLPYQQRDSGGIGGIGWTLL